MANIKSNIPNFLSQPLKRNYIGAITRTITLDLNPSPQIDIPHHFFFFFCPPTHQLSFLSFSNNRPKTYWPLVIKLID